jgi:NAD(P)-dependent dehydrogenase (short-subunit alcohol dehydrogenase family)
MRVTQAILPLMRARGYGRIAFTSSSTAWAPVPFMSLYAAAKAATSSYAECLDKETRSVGDIRCVAFECGGFPTHLGQPREKDNKAAANDAAVNQEDASASSGSAAAAYGPLFGELVGKFASDPAGHMPGDVARASARIVDVVKQEGMAAGRPWAVRVALGSDGLWWARRRCEEQLVLAAAWEDVSRSTDQDGQEPAAPRDMPKFTTVLE